MDACKLGNHSVCRRAVPGAHYGRPYDRPPTVSSLLTTAGPCLIRMHRNATTRAALAIAGSVGPQRACAIARMATPTESDQCATFGAPQAPRRRGRRAP